MGGRRAAGDNLAVAGSGSGSGSRYDSSYQLPLPATTNSMVVQKFGGTSVADPEAIRRLIEIVRTARTRDGRGPVVVVSAMSKVTDALLAIASTAGAGRPERRAPACRRASRAPRVGGARARVRSGADAAARAHRRAVRSARRHRPRARHPARGLAAHARRGRGDGRASQLAHRRRGADRGRRARRLGRCPLRHRHRRRAHARRAARPARPTPRCARRSTPILDAGRCRCSADSSARRRMGIRRRSGAAARTIPARSSAPASTRARFRSGPTWTAC